MKIGVVKDLKQGEARVGMTPENVKILVEVGHTLYVENNAGLVLVFQMSSISQREPR